MHEPPENEAAPMRHRFRLLLLLAGCALALGACAAVPADGEPVSPTTTRLIDRGHAPVNGIRMYYELHGPAQDAADGVPLVLLHGGGSTIDVSFSQVLPLFAQHRRGGSSTMRTPACARAPDGGSPPAAPRWRRC